MYTKKNIRPRFDDPIDFPGFDDPIDFPAISTPQKNHRPRFEDQIPFSKIYKKKTNLSK